MVELVGGGGASIFILGIAARSGTNFLWDLLRLHPACAPARPPITEDYFLYHADLLAAYTTAVQRSWDPDWGDFPADLGDELQASLGRSLTSFLQVDPTRRLLTKTPSVRNLDRFPLLFPGADLVILVRDGRSVAESCMTTFGWDLETAARRWVRAANQIRRFDIANRDRDVRYLIVRYEDLLDDLAETMSGMFRFLGLDAAAYDVQAAEGLPVRGSSVHLGPGRSRVHWEPVPRTPDFDPKERWRGWSVAWQDRFIWIADQQLRHFGYDSHPPIPHTRGRAATHRLLDWRWRTSERIQAARARFARHDTRVSRARP
ncbi:MAG: sulfotransferase [Euzebyales bacterium]|nr:sulfotransferase [Euzebyales bacterium]